MRPSEVVSAPNADGSGFDRRDPGVFARNVRAFRALRGWSIRDLANRAGVSTKTIVKIESGESCTVRTERKIANGFAAYLGRLWDPALLSDERQRVIRRDHGRWFFATVADAERYYRRTLRSQQAPSEERMRSDPDEIQDETERHRLGHAGLAGAFARAMGGGIRGGYFQYNECEIFGRDTTPPDGFDYTYLITCARGGVRLSIRERRYDLQEGDAIVYEGDDEYTVEPCRPVGAQEPPPLIHLVCLKVLTLPKPKPE